MAIPLLLCGIGVLFATCAACFYRMGAADWADEKKFLIDSLEFFKSENDELRELMRDMLPFAEVGFEDTCPTKRCCLFVECDAMSDRKCRVEEHMSQRLHKLGVGVDE